MTGKLINYSNKTENSFILNGGPRLRVAIVPVDYKEVKLSNLTYSEFRRFIDAAKLCYTASHAMHGLSVYVVCAAYVTCVTSGALSFCPTLPPESENMSFLCHSLYKRTLWHAFGYIHNVVARFATAHRKELVLTK